MYNELTNLIPLDRQRAISREYYLRLGVVVVSLLTAITLVAAILLAPTYIFLAASSKAKQTRLANIESTISSADEVTLGVRLTTLSNNIATLTTFESMPSVSTIIRTILGVSRPGITLSSFAYTSAVPKFPRKLIISGTSATRDALRNYQIALQNVPLVLSVDLPISAYAKDINIMFTISVTFAP